MRNFVVATVAATLIATSAFAATDVGAPLPAGNAAGVKKAVGEDPTIWYLVAGGFVVAGFALIASNGNSTLVTGTTGTVG